MYYYLYLIAENKKIKSPILDLSYRPDAFDDATNPENSVSLSAHYLMYWPEGLSELTHLEELNLSGHSNIAFPDDFATLFPHLRRLILHGSILEKLPNAQGLDIDWNLYQQHKNLLRPEQIVGVYYSNNDFGTACSEGDKLPCNDFITALTALKLPNLQFLKIEATLIHCETIQLSDKIAELTTLKELSLVNNNLLILPEVLGQLKTLERLIINKNYLSELPAFVYEFPNLKYLNLYNNYIADFGDGLAKLQKLEYLDIGENYISILPESIAGLPQLRVVRLSKFGAQAQKVNQARATKSMSTAGDEPTTYNLMTQISGQVNPQGSEPLDQNHDELILNMMPILVQMPNLEFLDLSHNQIRNLPENFGDLLNLKVLFLQQNALNQLPNSFEKLTKIEFLQLSLNEFYYFPTQIFKLSKLESLFLNRSLFSAQSWRDALPIVDVDLFDTQPVVEESAMELEFKSNGVAVVPNFFGQLPLLQKLAMRANKLSNAAFLAEVFELPNLILLDICENQFSKLPDTFSKESSLELLLLKSAELVIIPTSIKNLKKLNYADFSNNKLTEIFTTVGDLNSLGLLSFANNEILEIPESFCELSALKAVDFSSNKITKLPKGIHKLKQLENLNFRDNHLSKIPFELSLLPNLKELDISSCGLRKIPKEILLTEGLECICNNNGLISPPLEIAQNGIDAVKAYFEDLEKQKSDYLNEAKLMIVGSPGAGKTTLRVKLFDVNNPMPTAEDSTEGIDIEQLLFKLPDNGQFRMNIWDFGGQELYHSTHQFFYTRRSLYVLVLNTRRDDDRIDYWLNNIRFFGADSPIIIVQNQEKDRSYALNEQRYRNQFPNIKAFVALNLSNSAAVPALLDLIKKTIVEIPQTGDELPANWMEIRQALAEKAKNEAYISYSEFESICRERDVDSAENIAVLCRYLHELGTLLHFSENRILKNIVFLRSTWVLDAVYKVLDNDLVKNKQGACFRESDLNEIWLHPDYKKVKDELLELMLKFEICYLLPDGQSFLVPQLLPPNPPAFEFPSENALSLRYVYDFMPRGLLTRFIVQMNPYIADLGLVWKEGVILKRLDALAKITEDYDNKTLFIKIAGTNAKELSAIIFDELDRIHNSFPQVPQVQKLIPCNCSLCITAGNEPFLYDHKKLLGYIENKRDMVVCDKSYKDVPVRPLLDGLHNPLLAQVGDGVEILFVAANPRDTQPLDLDKEVEMLREVVESGRHQDHIRVEQRWEVSYDKLQQTVLKVHPEIVHFSGHGISEGLILEKADGLSTVADAALLEGLFAPLKNEVFCIIFNACYSESQAKVVSKHIPFVVGMNTAVSDKAALLFTKGFYRGLSNRLDVEFAFSMGINMVQSESPNQVAIFELWKNGEKV